jgi:hypothetical protein
MRLALSVLALWPAVALAQTASLQVTPASINLASGEQRQVVITAQAGDAAITSPKLSSIADPGIQASIPKPLHETVPAKGAAAWTATVRKLSDGRTAGRVVFRLDHQTGVALATLDVQVTGRAKTDEVLAAKIETSLEKLEERRARSAYLTLTNISDVPVTVRSVRAGVPGFVSVNDSPLPKDAGIAPYSTDLLGSAVVLEPRQMKTIPATLLIPAYTSVQAGKYLLVFEIRAEYEKSGYPTNADLFVSREFSTGVLGEQEFVGVTSVPFLLLPGFMLVLTFGLLYTKVWPRRGMELDFKKPEFYLFGILASILAVRLYPVISPALYWWLWRVQVPARDYLEGYSINDIFNVWISAVLSGFLLWALISGTLSLIAWARSWWHSERTPSPDDQPVEFLRKLERTARSFQLPQFDWDDSGHIRRLWIAPLDSPDPAKKWVVPRIRVQMTKLATDQDSEELANRLRVPAKPGELADLLQQLRDRKAAEIEWEAVANVPGPTLFEAKLVRPNAGAGDDFIYERV